MATGYLNGPITAQMPIREIQHRRWPDTDIINMTTSLTQTIYQRGGQLW